ncbi:putative leader peptide [Embleya sp. NPDC050154]
MIVSVSVSSHEILVGRIHLDLLRYAGCLCRASR